MIGEFFHQRNFYMEWEKVEELISKNESLDSLLTKELIQILENSKHETPSTTDIPQITKLYLKSKNPSIKTNEGRFLRLCIMRDAPFNEINENKTDPIPSQCNLNDLEIEKLFSPKYVKKNSFLNLQQVYNTKRKFKMKFFFFFYNNKINETIIVINPKLINPDELYSFP